MKNLLLAILILAPITLIGQSRNDNALVIQTGMEGIESLLLKNFYEITHINEERFATKPKPIEGSVYAYDLTVSLHGFIADDELIVYANYSFRGGLGNQETYSGRADYQRRRNVGRRLAFDEMDRVFKQLKKPIEYRNMK